MVKWVIVRWEPFKRIGAIVKLLQNICTDRHSDLGLLKRLVGLAFRETSSLIFKDEFFLRFV